MSLWLLPASLHAAAPACLASLFDDSGQRRSDCSDTIVLPAAPAPIAAAPVPDSAQEDDTDWRLDEGTAVRGADRSSPSAPEQLRFWDRLENGAFNDICRNLKVHFRKEYVPQEPNAGKLIVDRYFRRYPNRSIALVDSTEFYLALGHAEQLASLGDNLPVNLSVSMRAEGISHVVRVLGSSGTCSELGHMANVLDFKTVIPVRAGRIAKMEVGELWKLPLTLTTSIGPSVGAPAGVFQVILGLGKGKAEGASVTLLRLSEDQIRLRLRFDRAELRDQVGSFKLSLPIEDYLNATGNGTLLKNEWDNQRVRFVSDFLKTELQIWRWRRIGRKVLLEFTLDPTDSQQLQSLEKFLKGDLRALLVLAKAAHRNAVVPWHDAAKPAYLSKLEQEYAQKLGVDPNFSGVDDYERRGRRRYANLPLIIESESVKSRELDRIVADDRDVEVDIAQTYDTSNRAYLNVPGLGQMFKRNHQKTVQAFTQVDSNGLPDSPMLAYIQQDGFLRYRERTARAMVDNANDILRYAGTRGEGVNPRLTLPADKIFPAQAGADNPLYRSAVSALTLVWNKRALEDILWAPADVIVKSFVNALGGADKDMMRKVLAHTRITADGIISYDLDAVAQALGQSLSASSRLLTKVNQLCRSAAGMVADLIAAREGDWRLRTDMLVRVISGDGRSGLQYEQALKVLIQLVNPDDVFGEFTINTDKRIKGAEDVKARYSLNPANANGRMQTTMQLKEKFAEPTLLSD